MTRVVICLICLAAMTPAKGQPQVLQPTPATATLWQAVDHSQHSQLAISPNQDVGTAQNNRFHLAVIENRIAAMKYERDVFEWQLLSSKVIFYLVVFLVVVGVAFAAVQFSVGIRHHAAAESDEAELTLRGLKIRSQYLGVITLIVSLAFFFLYLRTVYPITYVANAAAQSEPANGVR